MSRAVVFLFFLCACACACASVPEITYVEGGTNTCPNNVPSAYADMCCGSVACKGANCISACQDCESSCKATDLCCPNTQSRAVCRPSLTCP